MAIIKKVNNEEKIIANISITDHNQLTGTENYGCHPISAIRKLPEKLTTLKNKDTEIETASKGINVVGEDDGTITFTDYEGNSTNIRAGYLPEEETIVLTDEEKLRTVSLYNIQDDTILTPKNIKDRFNSNEEDIDGNTEAIRTIQEVDIVQTQQINDLKTRTKGLGGYLDGTNFGTATPAQEQLTNYALQQIGITDPLEIFNQTKVKNFNNNHIWILTNTPDSTPAVFEWADNGVESIGDANNDGIHGLVTGSYEDLEGFIDINGHISINNLPENLVQLDNNITTNSNKMGDLDTLTTAVNDNLVNAVNEVNSEVYENIGSIIKLDFNATRSPIENTTNYVITGEPTTTIDISELNPGNIYMIDITYAITGDVNPNDYIDLDIVNLEDSNGIKINFKAPNNVTGFARIGDIKQTQFPYNADTGHRWIFNALLIKNTINNVDTYFFGIIPNVSIQDIVTADAETLVDYEVGDRVFNYNNKQLFLCAMGNNAAYKENHLYEANYNYRDNTVTFIERSDYQYKTIVFSTSGESPSTTTKGEIGSRSYNTVDNIWWTCTAITAPINNNGTFTYTWLQDTIISPDVILTTIVEGKTPLEVDWLNTTPVANTIYIIRTIGDYYNLQYLFNTNTNLYEQTGGGQVDIDNITIEENTDGNLQAIALINGDEIVHSENIVTKDTDQKITATKIFKDLKLQNTEIINVSSFDKETNYMYQDNIHSYNYVLGKSGLFKVLKLDGTIVKDLSSNSIMGTADCLRCILDNDNLYVTNRSGLYKVDLTKINYAQRNGTVSFVDSTNTYNVTIVITNASAILESETTGTCNVSVTYDPIDGSDDIVIEREMTVTYWNNIYGSYEYYDEKSGEKISIEIKDTYIDITGDPSILSPYISSSSPIIVLDNIGLIESLNCPITGYLYALEYDENNIYVGSGRIMRIYNKLEGTWGNSISLLLARGYFEFFAKYNNKLYMFTSSHALIYDLTTQTLGKLISIDNTSIDSYIDGIIYAYLIKGTDIILGCRGYLAIYDTLTNTITKNGLTTPITRYIYYIQDTGTEYNVCGASSDIISIYYNLENPETILQMPSSTLINSWYTYNNSKYYLTNLSLVNVLITDKSLNEIYAYKSRFDNVQINISEWTLRGTKYECTLDISSLGKTSSNFAEVSLPSKNKDIENVKYIQDANIYSIIDNFNGKITLYSENIPKGIISIGVEVHE